MDRKRSFEEYRDDGQLEEPLDGRVEQLKLQKTTQGPVTGLLNYDEEPQPSSGETQSNKNGWQTVNRERRGRGEQIRETESELHPAITHSNNARLQRHLTITDFRELITYLLLGTKAPYWVAIRHRGAIRKVVALMIPGLEVGMFNGQIALREEDLDESTAQDDAMSPQWSQENGLSTVTGKSKKEYAVRGSKNGAMQHRDTPDDYYPVKIDIHTLPAALQSFGKVFSHAWPVRAATDDRLTKVFSPVFGILTAPSERLREERHVKGVKPIKAERYENKNTPITEYLATIEDLQENEYPLHLAFGTTDSAKEVLLACRNKYHQTIDDGWVDSRVHRLEDGDVLEQDTESSTGTAGRKILAVDCEMVKTAANPLTLARVSVVDWDGNVVLDELVKPEQPVIDYVTFYSGITEEMLKPVTTTIGDIQKRLLEIVTPQTILVGHSLESDLKALKFAHPFIIDTVLQYPHPRGPPLKSGLSFLAEKYLGKRMKRDRVEGGHDSIEDARAALELIKLKCWKGPSFGTSEGNGESIFKRLRRTARLKSASADADAEEFKAGAVVDWGDPSRGHGAAANIVISCKTDAEVVEGIKRVVNSSNTNEADSEAASSTEAVDFVWARFRELEAIRGWWSSSSPGDTEEHRQNVFDRYSSTDPTKDPTAPTPEALGKTVKQVAVNVADVYAALPTCTAFIVYSGSGDMREVFRLGDIQRQFRREYATRKWEELSVRWTDNESQALRSAVKKAREGVGFVVVK